MLAQSPQAAAHAELATILQERIPADAGIGHEAVVGYLKQLSAAGLETLVATEQRVAEVRRPLFGREADLDRLRARLKPEGSLTVVTGPAGIGKSALMVAFADAAQSDGVFVARHFFSFEREHLRGRVPALQSILAQLQRHTGQLGEPPEGIHPLRSALVNILQSDVPDDAPVLVLLDGLDEADGILEAFSLHRLGRNVHLMVSARADKDETPPLLSSWLPRRGAADNRVPVGPLTTEAASAWLTAALGETRVAVVDRGRVESALYRVTDGVPLFLDFILRDLAARLEQGEPGETVAARLGALPGSFVDYAEEKLREYDAWGLSLRRLFALLSVAKGPLRIAEIEALLGAEGNYRALDHRVERWFRRRRSNGRDSESLAFTHPRFALVFAEVLESDADKERARLVEWCSVSWREGCRYALTYLVEHLMDMDRNDPTLSFSASNQDDVSNSFLSTYDWISKKLRYTSINSILNDYEIAHDPDLMPVQDALRISAHTVAIDPNQLAGQLVGRLRQCPGEAPKRLVRSVHAQASGPWLNPLTPILDAPKGSWRQFLSHGQPIAMLKTLGSSCVISITEDKCVKVWDLTRMMETIHSVEWNTRPISGCSAELTELIIDGIQRLVVAAGETPYLSLVPKVAASRCGNCLVFGTEIFKPTSVWMVDADTGSARVIGNHPDGVRDIAMTPDGRRAVSGGNSGIFKLWDLERGCEMHSCDVAKIIDSVAITPDAKLALLSTGSNGEVLLWSLTEFRALKCLDTFSAPVVALAVAPNGKIAAAGGPEGDVRLLALADLPLMREQAVRVLGRHAAQVRAVTFVDDTCVVTGSEDGRVGVWKTDTSFALPDAAHELRRLHTDTFVAVSARRAVSGGKGAIGLWDLETGARLCEVPVVDERGINRIVKLHPVANSADVMSQDAVGGIARWTVEGNTIRGPALQIRDNASHVAFDEAGRTALRASPDRLTLQLVDIFSESKQVLADYRDFSESLYLRLTGVIRQISDLRCYRALVAIRVCETRTDYLEGWNIEDGIRLWRIEANDHDDIWTTAISQNGKVGVSGCWGGVVKAWAMDSGCELGSWRHPSHAAVEMLAVTPDNAHVISGARSDDNLRMWGLLGQDTETFPCSSPPVSFSLSQGGKYFWVSSHDRQIKVWDFATRRPLTALDADRICELTAVVADGTVAMGRTTSEGWEEEVRGHPVIIRLEARRESPVSSV